MKTNLKKIIKTWLVVVTVQSFCYYSADVASAAEYDSLIDAIQATTTPRTYTLDGNETSSTALGNIGGWNSVLTIDGGEGHYGINNTSTATDTRLFVGKNQTLYLQNLGTYTTTTSSSIVEGVDIITEVTVGNSINNFGKTSDRVGFLRSAGTSHISNSVFYNNRGRYGVVQNREQGTMSITGSVFANNNVPQGAVHNDGTNRMTEISDSIFYNNTAVTQTSGDTDLRNRSASAIFNKPGRTIDIISGSQFIGNTTISTADGQQTGTIYNNGGTIGEISNSVFYNNSNQSGSVIHNVSSTTAAGVLNNGTITTISNSVFVQNTSVGSGAAISNTSDSIIGAITDSLFISNTATANGGAIYNEGDIAALAGTFTSNSADSNGGAIYNTGTVTITSSDGANTTFTGNTANGVSNALYNTGTVNMNAGTDSSIIFNDKITGSDGVITLGGAGVVEFNETVAGNSVTLNSGTLKLGLADSLQDVTNFTVNGGILDLRNDEVHSYQLGQSTSINGTVGLAIDADLAGTNPAADMITAAGAVSGSGSFVFSSANINIMSYPDEQTPFWVQVTDENLRDYAGLGSNSNIQITGGGPEGYFITYETSHDGVDAGFLHFEHDTLWNAIASSVAEKAYTLGTNETLANTPALGGDSLTINGNSQGYSIAGDGGEGLAVGDGQTLSLNNIGIDSEGNVTGAGLNNFNTAVSNAANGTVNIYNTTFSNNTTDIDNDGVVNMSGTVIFDNAEGEGTVNIAKDTDGNSSTVTVNNSLEQNNINVESENTLTNDNATVTVNAALNNAGTIAGTGTSTLVINGDSSNSGTIDQGTLATAADATLTNTGDVTVQTTLTNNGTIENNNDLTLAGSDMINAGTVTGTGATYVTGKVTNEGTIAQDEIQISSDGELISNASNITATAGITNEGSLELTGGVVSSDISGAGSTAITDSIQNSANIAQGSITLDNGKTLTNDNGATITTTTNAGFQNNGTVLNDGAISVAGGSNAGSITGNGTFTNSGDFTNSDSIDQDTITNSGTITTNSENLVAASGITNNGTLIYNSGSQTVSDITGDGSVNSHVELRTNSSFTINNTIANTYIDLYNSTLSFGDSGDISGATALNLNGGGLNLLDGNITSTDLGTVNLNAQSDISIDLDLSSLTSDSFNATVNNNGGIFNISQVNLLGAITADYVNINLGDMTGLGQENVTSATIELPSVMTPIRRINGRIEDGWLTYSGTGTGIADFNPAVLATPVIAQAGIQTIMDNTFQHAYEHADWYTKFSAQERSAILTGNLDATNNVANGGDYNQANLSNQYKKNLAIWFKSYASFEDISLRPGPKVDVNSYGSLVGVDSNFQDWGRDWYGVTTGYIGYNGAHIDYPEVRASMDGGLLGVTQTFYKNNFWTGVTANAGVNFANARTMYGREDSTILATGLGTQTGYNIELGAGNFILQPIWLMNYSLINTFSYTNAAGVKIDPKPLHTIQLNPTLRLVGNVKGWQPYASVGMVWNLMNKTDVMADAVKLPEISTKPYVRYDVGVQKAIGNKFTGFIQVAGYNGGRNGIDIAGGLRWAFGKGGKNPETVVQGDNNMESAVSSQNMQEPQAVEPVAEAQTTDAEQETIRKAEKPVVNVQETAKPQPNGRSVESAANTPAIDTNQRNVQAEEPVAEVAQINKDQQDTKAEEVAANAPQVKGEPENAQAEEYGDQTQDNNNLAKAIAIGAVLLLLIFLLTRKW